MHVNGIRFINTIYGHINFMTAEQIANAESSTLHNYIRQVNIIYIQWGFKVVNILTDGQFECIRGDLSKIQVNLNIWSNNEHVGEIERLNITIKERSVGICNTMPLKTVTGMMIVDIIALVVFCINALPPSPSIEGDLSPRHIFTRMTLEHTKILSNTVWGVCPSPRSTW